MTSHPYAGALEFSDLGDSFSSSSYSEHPLPDRLPGRLTLGDWPRRIRIYTLGRFALVKDGVPIAFIGRPQHKPMSLLKAVLALGGNDVDSQEVIAALWPAAEGDAARNAFDVTLHRLRRLTQSNDVVILKEGKLSLDSSVCWVDVWEFERLLVRIEKAVRDADAKSSLATLAERMLKLHRGPFLNSESEPWMLAPRERLRIKFQRHIVMLGRSLERVAAWDEAAEIYQRALELDPLIEEFHRHLMLCHRQAGRISEAHDTYRRCRDILSITLGIQPSCETQTVYRSLGQR